jgi:hypothetical protein
MVMRILLFLFIVMSSFKSQEQPPKYTWNGKNVTYKQYRDSLRVEYLKYCDSLKRNKIIVSK